jgi:processing peptidase subunit beta
MGSDVGAAVEILSDILQGSTLEPAAIERERGVILREMEEVEKNKEEVVFDHLHGTAFQGNSLGYTILGPEENINSITRQHLQDYIAKNYTAERMVLVGSGNVDHAELVKLAEKHFGHLKVGEKRSLISKPKFIGSEVRARYDNHPTAHIAMSVEGCLKLIIRCFVDIARLLAAFSRSMYHRIMGQNSWIGASFNIASWTTNGQTSLC